MLRTDFLSGKVICMYIVMHCFCNNVRAVLIREGTTVLANSVGFSKDCFW